MTPHLRGLGLDAQPLRDVFESYRVRALSVTPPPPPLFSIF